jgi:alkyl hydroperoxide reductase subunit AhpC
LTKQQKENTQLLAVSVDSHAVSKKFGEMLRKRFDGEFDFPLLEDKDHQVIDRYGIFNPDGRGGPHSATYVIDPRESCAGNLSKSMTTNAPATSRFAARWLS